MWASRPFQVAADVEDRRPAGGGGPGPGRRRSRGGRSPSSLGAGPVGGAAGGVGGGPVDADPDQFALGFGHLLQSLAEQGDRRPPGDEPAQVGGEAAVEAEVQGASRVPGGEGDPVAQVDHPLAVGETFADLVGVGPLRRGQVRGGRTGGVGRGHVGVVGRPGVQPGQQSSATNSSLWLRSARGWPASPRPMVEALASDLGGRAEAAEAVSRVDGAALGQLRGQPVGRGVLVVHQGLGVGGAEQVGTADRPVQQRPTGEHRQLPPARPPTG